VTSAESADVRWVYAFVDRPRERLASAGAFWTAVTGTRLSEPRGDHGEFATLLTDGTDPCVKLQGVDGGDGGAHLDLCAEDVPGLVERARALGARPVAPHDDWSVLASPGGQLFCAVPWLGEAVRPPVVAGSRLDQVCLDVPPSAYDAEVAFWSDLLAGWTSHWCTRPWSRAVRSSRTSTGRSRSAPWSRWRTGADRRRIPAGRP
jgi:hypothetical protein